jgi:hypothetical protein
VGPSVTVVIASVVVVVVLLADVYVQVTCCLAA